VEVHDELMNAYLVTYMPEPNPNEGYRKIQVRVNGTAYQIHTRAGYTPHPVMAKSYSAGKE
jgi:hypothetical protein